MPMNTARCTGKWEYESGTPDSLWPWSNAWDVNKGVRPFEVELIFKDKGQYEAKFKGDVPPNAIQQFIAFACSETLQSHFEEGEVIKAWVNQRDIRLQITNVFYE